MSVKLAGDYGDRAEWGGTRKAISDLEGKSPVR